MDDNIESQVRAILEREKLAYLATSNNTYVDNATICYWSDEAFNIYFGSYSDTLKCINIKQNPYVGVAISTLQIHGVARKIEYGSNEYKLKIQGYNWKFPQYAHVFNNEKNELYSIKPLVIWNYNPSESKMHRDKIILDNEYFMKVNCYEPPTKYELRMDIEKEVLGNDY